jgi:quercetin dioxygenase-like cupin family protein
MIIKGMHAFRLSGVLLLAAIAVTDAQVPLSKEPRHRVTFENAQLRILDVNIPPGETSLDHRHEFDIATVAMTSGAETREQAAAQPQGPVRPSRSLGDVNVAEYTGKPASHTIANVGSIPYQLFAVENLRAKGWSPTPALSGAATTLTSESRAFRIYDVRLSNTSSATMHTHAVPTIAVLVGGKVLSDGPDTHAKTFAPAPVGLKQLDRPGQWLLVPAGDRHHVVRLGTDDARVVEIEVR